jgi:ABC-2 type transport system ATP-binding protein
VSFTVDDGEIFGIVGANGAGKTTTVECIEGLRRPDRGRTRVLGLDPHRDRDRLRQRLGVQLQEAELPDKLTVAEAIDLYRSFYRHPADHTALLETLGLADQRKTRYRKLSGGQKQRLSIALALIGRPKVAVLDELTTGLDPHARRDTWALIRDIRDQGVTILLVTHFMDEAERLCDRLALIHAGRVAALDTPAGLTDRINTEQRLRFRPSAPLDDRVLTALPEVTSLTRTTDEVMVAGTSNVLGAVTAALARDGIVAERLRVERPSLEDAFVALTGRQA